MRLDQEKIKKMSVSDCCEEAIRVLAGDPWAHRSKGMRCKTCMWFVEKSGPPVYEESKVVGRCRRHAPTMSGYPVVFILDYCGDHKLDETKI